MSSQSTRRLATFHVLLGFASAIAMAGCSGKLGLRYGETLCDSSHPCPAGYRCADSICIVDNSGDTDNNANGDTLTGEWDGANPDVDTATYQSGGFCRSDEQCSTAEKCTNGQCQKTPCADIQCGGNSECAATCIPLANACDGVKCTDNLEHCIMGQCVPSCDKDPCVDPGCNPSDPNCNAGHCTNGTLCYYGRCLAITDCGPTGQAYCGAGYQCTIACNAPDLCAELNCATGFSCVLSTDSSGKQTANCIGNLCSALTCPAGQTCINGSCLDTCEFIACADGGRECSDPNSVCCNGTCCPEGQLCRVVDPTKPGVCLPPSGVCNPTCASGQICVNGQCLCATYPTPQDCGTECCISGTCDNPCSPNPCTDPANPICNVSCGAPGGHVCVNGCGGSNCSVQQPNTQCDPRDGSCYCGVEGTLCDGQSCCLAKTGAPGGFQCDDPCSPNPCTSGSNLKCVRDCTQASGYVCKSYCDGVNCSLPNTSCDPGSGNCECGSAKTPCVAGSGKCCVPSGSDFTCVDPCASNPCGALQCVADCSQPAGYSCQNNCGSGACNGNYVNPDCYPANGACECKNLSNGVYTQCNSGQCCDDTGTCANPCSPNPCPADHPRCVVGCTASGADYTCLDPCQNVNCNSQTSGRDPDCRPDPNNSSTFQCWCASADTVCGSGTCCEGSSCFNPCSPNNCPNDGVPTHTKCNVNCNVTGDFTCTDPCAGNTCASNGQNPQCEPKPGDPQHGQCYCQSAGAVCSGGTCCLAGGCVDPCAGNPCGSSGACTRDCSQPSGYTCTNNCNCSQPNPDCTNAVTGTCSCNAQGASCGSGQCCLASGCVDPCAGNPCGANGVCSRDCTQPNGYVCTNECQGQTCPTQNPDCDPTQVNGALRCTCEAGNGSRAICSGGQCCIGGSCIDECASGDPCTTVPNTKCTDNCNSAGGFSCSDPCAGNNCGSAGSNNPQCRASGAKGDLSQCYCAASNSVCASGQCCSGSGCTNPCSGNPCGNTGKCVVDCTQGSGYTCQPQTCAASCVSPLTCDLVTGDCYCGTTDTTGSTCTAPQQNGAQVCCDIGSPSNPNLVCKARTTQCASATDCTPSAPGTVCGCDPCKGCYVQTGSAGAQCN